MFSKQEGKRKRDTLKTRKAEMGGERQRDTQIERHAHTQRKRRQGETEKE